MSTFSLYLLFLCLTLFAGKASSAIAPALYLFGGSSLDTGNNNFLQTQAKANFSPYGIDFPGGSTGRYTNCATSGDFIAAYLSLSERQRQTIITGINYASSAAGILPESETALGDILSLDEQINYFRTTVRNDLPQIFRTPRVLSHYLSRSVFVIAIGSTFFRADGYTESYAQFQDPVKYGFSEVRTPCCAVGALGTCLPGQEPYTDRNNHLYYDGVHPVQLVNYQFARNCFSGSTVCTPINIRQLAFKL
ncbi:hypothetical protein C5167_045665 [Papaver somniferum]|uniref:SGNH hydrolase-type esterase domain-containing protein n=1 Tax=Papaver somniferum TaxID=3469 RepID=A0A4Y7LDW7_PAPSO|nr:hypothetical protein C5167_045665 [Papaver somniferum]